ncbi:cation:proton antiporter [[Limnothrix rosea] IAM M-220]|uniref:cation:proton antiporter n=1 Tax=[Limnothrix rosea] IAM M-220 TaxID=454133 RepID=UPI0009626658|nr:cation:proton antiporter [[Limnothrix rosea] IAM M-220]OKH19344.1 sodium:proton antiporter [[Limnothrix rosea] IAM M-220]
MFSSSVEYLVGNPLFSFTLLLFVSLTVPPIFEKIKLPGLVGLLCAGILLGKDALGLLDPDSETMILFSDIGKVYLMFVAGLEINLAEFRKTQDRSLTFGFLTFLIPLLTGITVGLSFGFSWNAAILIGSLLASHTLLGYPIINRFGILANESITVTIGATIFTDIAALVVLAVCVSVHQGEFSWLFLATQLLILGIYGVCVLLGLSKLGHLFFRRSGDEESNQFLFILLAVFLASVGAQLINVDKIVGAFLAGLAVNDVVGHSPVKEKIEFVGSTLFIPFFFVGMGLLLDIPAFVNNLLYEFPLTLCIVFGLVGSKFAAAAIAKLLYRYSWSEALTMWSLSIPQVAATLAAALVGFRVGLISESVFNAVIVLMLVTSILGPILTTKFARFIAVPTAVLAELEPAIAPLSDAPYKVVIPLANPKRTDALMAAAALITRVKQGMLLPTSIVTAHSPLDDASIDVSMGHSHELLDQAIATSETLGIPAQPKIRIDRDVAAAITCLAREENAQLIIMGWSSTESLKARLLGSVINSVCWSAHCPVAALRLFDHPNNWRRILVPIKGFTSEDLQMIRFVQLLAIANQANMTLLHVSDPWMTKAQHQTFKTELQYCLAEAEVTLPVKIKVIRHHNIAKVIQHCAKQADLVVLHSTRYRTAGGLAVGDLTSTISSQLTTSILIFNE